MIHLRVIGESSIEIGETKIGPDSELLFSLLLYLVAERGRVVPRERMIDFFWPNVEAKRARHCLRQALYTLRKLGVSFHDLAAGIRIQTDDVTCDFDQLQRGQLDPHTLPTSAEVLPGITRRSMSVDFRDWLDAFESRLRQIMVAQCETYLRLDRRNGSHIDAAHLAELCLSLDPLNELATLALAESQALRGDRHSAIALLDKYLEETNGTSVQPGAASVLRKRVAERTRDGVVTPRCELIGRDPEILQLRTAAANAYSGGGQAICVHGPAGIGKTRLMLHAETECRLGGFRVIRVACHANAVNRPLGLMLRLVPQLVRLPGALGAAPSSLSLLRSVCSEVSDQLALPRNEEDAEQRFAAIRTAVRDLLDAVSGEAAVALLIEDAHWMDAPSTAILAEFISTNADRRTLIVVTSREFPPPPLRHPHIDARLLQVRALAPLTVSASHRYADNLCASFGVRATPEVLETLARLGGGNPFFIGELIAHWLQTRDLTQLPVSLEAVLGARLEALAQTALMVLQIIALIGRPVDLEILGAVLAMQSWQVIGGVDELQKARLIVTREGRWELEHELVGAAALRVLATGTRRLLHARIAQELHIESKKSNDASSLFEAANHWYASGDAQRAREAAVECARHVSNIGLPREAARIIKSSLIFADLPNDRLELFGLRSLFLLESGDFRAAAANAEDADKDSLAKNADRHSDAEIALYRSWHSAMVAPPPNVVVRAVRCSSDSSASTEHRLSAAVWGLTAALANPPFQYASTLADIVENIVPVSRPERAQRLMFQLIYETELGSCVKARAAGDQLLELAIESQCIEVDRALRSSSLPYRLLGDWSEANFRLREAVRLATLHDRRTSVVSSYAQLAWLHFDSGDDESAWRLYLEATNAAAKYAGIDRLLLDLIGATIAARQQRTTEAFRLAAAVPTDHAVVTVRLTRAAAESAAELVESGRLRKRLRRLLSQLTAATRTRPFADFCNGVLCQALLAEGNIEGAYTAACVHMSGRRELWKPRDKWLLMALGARGSPPTGCAAAFST